MGFRESNAAHQRTAERSHALEEELHNTRKVADTLRAESAALEGQVKFPKGYKLVLPCLWCLSGGHGGAWSGALYKMYVYVKTFEVGVAPSL